jgi:Outer membrane lipoprotein-sorting protein
MNESLFGSDLSYEDVIENFYAWEHQAIAGTEVVDRVSCLILESKPSQSDHSTYASVRSWVDPRRFVPLRVATLPDFISSHTLCGNAEIASSYSRAANFA